jgi:hypothetical protein
MLRAVARRNNPEFEHYREHMNQDESEKKRLYPLLYEVFRSVVDLRFEGEQTVEQVRAFLGRPRQLLWPDKGFSTANAEALIRSVLGERGLVSGIATGDVVTTRMQTITYLVEDMQLSEQDLNALISESEELVAVNQ